MFEILNNHGFLDKICTYMGHVKEQGCKCMRSSGGESRSVISLGSGRLSNFEASNARFCTKSDFCLSSKMSLFRWLVISRPKLYYFMSNHKHGF